MMFCRRYVLGLALAILGGAPTIAHADASDDAVRTRTEVLTALMRELPQKTSEAQKTAKLDPYFDFDALTQAPIKAHAKAFKPAERAKLEAVFNRLVRHLAYASGDSMRRGEPKVQQSVRAGGKKRRIVDVMIRGAEEDVDDQISFVWEQRQTSWQIVDVELDGASVAKDYENQFGKIIKKDGAKALLKKMEARLSQAEQGNESTQQR